MRMPSKDARASAALLIDKYHANLDGLASYLDQRGINRETADRFLLGQDDKGRLTIPYLTPAGPWCVKRRCTENHDCKTVEGHAKYKNEPGVDLHLFNAQTLLTAQYVIVTEGELDAVVAEQHGIAAVAYPGANAWASNKHWRFCFESADEVVVVADGDEPGRKAAAGVVESLKDSINGDVRLVVMPDGHDVSSFVESFGGHELLAELGWL